MIDRWVDRANDTEGVFQINGRRVPGWIGRAVFKVLLSFAALWKVWTGNYPKGMRESEVIEVDFKGDGAA